MLEPFLSGYMSTAVLGWLGVELLLWRRWRTLPLFEYADVLRNGDSPPPTNSASRFRFPDPVVIISLLIATGMIALVRDWARNPEGFYSFMNCSMRTVAVLRGIPEGDLLVVPMGPLWSMLLILACGSVAYRVLSVISYETLAAFSPQYLHHRFQGSAGRWAERWAREREGGKPKGDVLSTAFIIFGMAAVFYGLEERPGAGFALWCGIAAAFGSFLVIMVGASRRQRNVRAELTSAFDPVKISIDFRRALVRSAFLRWTVLVGGLLVIAPWFEVYSVDREGIRSFRSQMITLSAWDRVDALEAEFHAPEQDDSRNRSDRPRIAVSIRAGSTLLDFNRLGSLQFYPRNVTRLIELVHGKTIPVKCFDRGGRASVEKIAEKVSDGLEAGYREMASTLLATCAGRWS